MVDITATANEALDMQMPKSVLPFSLITTTTGPRPGALLPWP